MFFGWYFNDKLRSVSISRNPQLSETVKYSLPILSEIRLPSSTLIKNSIVFSIFFSCHHLVHHRTNFRRVDPVRPSNSTLVTALNRRLPSSANLNFSASITENNPKTQMVNNRNERTESCDTTMLVLNVSFLWPLLAM